MRRATLWSLVLIGVMTIGIAMGYIFSTLQIIALPPAQLGGPSSAEAMVLKTQLDYYERRADDIQKIASAMLLFSTLFTAVAGVTAYININQAVEKADALVTSADEKLRDLKSKTEIALESLDGAIEGVRRRADQEISEIRREFPMFGYMNHATKRILDELTTLLDPEFLLPGVARADMYGQLSVEKRQRILFYENTVAALSLFDLRAHSAEMSRIYRGLGLFFASKSYGGGGPAKVDEIAKAFFYFERANADSESAPVLNDMAYFTLDPGRPEALIKAEQLLLRSLDAFKNQQRARMNLGYIYIVQREYPKAESVLREALAKTSWETGKDLTRPTDITYNLACALAGLGRYQEATESLERIFKAGAQDWLETLKSNTADPEDELGKLANDTEYGPRIRALVEGRV